MLAVLSSIVPVINSYVDCTNPRTFPPRISYNPCYKNNGQSQTQSKPKERKAVTLHAHCGMIDVYYPITMTTGDNNYTTSNLRLSNLSLNGAAAVVTPPAADSIAADNNAQPNLNILNQVGSVTQLNANNTSFDPNQVLGQVVSAEGSLMAVSSPSPSGGTTVNNNHQPPPSQLQSFLIQPSPSSASSVSAPQPAAQLQQPASLLVNSQISQIPSTQVPPPPAANAAPQSVATTINVNGQTIPAVQPQVLQPPHQPTPTMGAADTAALFPNISAPSKAVTVSIGAGTPAAAPAPTAAAAAQAAAAPTTQAQVTAPVSSAPAPASSAAAVHAQQVILQQQQATIQAQRQIIARQQAAVAQAAGVPGAQVPGVTGGVPGGVPVTNPMYAEKKDYVYADKKTLMNGRVPATRRDGRKLFVGGLPNEG